MRGLGYALIVFGVITAVLIFLYFFIIGWSGLTGSITAILTGIGFLTMSYDDCRVRENHSCNCCNRY